MPKAPVVQPYQSARFKAYLSEPITKCPTREKGRIKTLVNKLADTLAQEPYDTSVYIPSLITSPEKRAEMSPEHIYLLDRIRIVEADYMMVVADHTSFGIGGEVEMASSLGKPIIFFSRDESVSRFLIGTPANLMHGRAETYIHYRDWRDLKPKLLPRIRQVIDSLGSSELEQVPFWDISARLKSLRERAGLSRDELAQRTGLLASQIRVWEMSMAEIRRVMASYEHADLGGVGAIELNARQKEQLFNPGLAALHRLSHTLGVTIGELVGETDGALLRKGPAKVANTVSKHVRNSRLESLAIRAEQFDITFREYQALIEILIDNRTDLGQNGGQTATRFVHMIGETEFSHALKQIRARYR